MLSFGVERSPLRRLLPEEGDDVRAGNARPCRICGGGDFCEEDDDRLVVSWAGPGEVQVDVQPEGSELTVVWRLFDGMERHVVRAPLDGSATFDAIDLIDPGAQDVSMSAVIEAHIDGVRTAVSSVPSKAFLWAHGPVVERAPIVAPAGGIDRYLPPGLQGAGGVFRGVAARHGDTTPTFVEVDLSDRAEDVRGARAPIPPWAVAAGQEVRP